MLQIFNNKHYLWWKGIQYFWFWIWLLCIAASNEMINDHHTHYILSKDKPVFKSVKKERIVTILTSQSKWKVIRHD